MNKLWEGEVTRKKDGGIIPATVWEMDYAIVVLYNEDIHLLNEVVLPDGCKWILEKEIEKLRGSPVI